MKRVFLPSTSGSAWQKLLAKPTLHWKRGFSAMSAAASWEAAGDKLPPEIAKALDSSYVPEVRNLKLLAAIPEWETPLPGGSRPSFTDILAVTRNDDGLCVVAVEAKANEDFGPAVAEKLSETASQGEKDRLRYLQELLNLRSLNPAIRYQLLHRTASALLAAQEFFASTAVMLVHSFGQRPELRADFDRFCDAMGAESPGAAVRQVRIFDQPRLVLAWVDGEKRYADQELDWDPVFEMHRGLGDPKEALRLLDELEALGFDDQAFALLGHLRDAGRSDTIAAYRQYCRDLKGRFESGGVNEAVQKRLKMVLAAYRRGGFQSGRDEVFRHLAQAAWEETSM